MRTIFNSLKMLLCLTLITGFIYPLFITLIGQFAFQELANGNFVVWGDKVVGATLIGQKFEENRYFWGRPSAINYNPLPSGGSNLGPTSAKLQKMVEERRHRIAEAHHITPQNVPSELLFASGSGVDPHISPQTAYFQIDRIIQARKLPSNAKERILNLITKQTINPYFAILGTPVINVLLLNKDLDELSLSMSLSQ